MSRPLRFLPLLLCILLRPFILVAEHDIERTVAVDFYIKEDPNLPLGYSLHSEHSTSITFLSQRSKEWREFSIGESYFNNISDIAASLDDEEVGKKAIAFSYPKGQDVFLSDYKVHTIEFPATLDTGQTATYSYRTDYKDIRYFPLLYLPNSDYTKSYTVAIHHPQNVRVAFQPVFSRATVPYTIDTSNPEKTVFSCANVYKDEYLNHFDFNSTKAWIQVHLHNDTTSLTPTLLPAFTEWYRTLFNQQPAFEAPYDTLLATQIATAPDTRAKIAAIHDYVRKTIRYIAEEHALNAIVPRKPSLVLSRGYGDCKDRAYLVASLAHQYNIPNVYMALICTEPRPALNGTHIFQYNHVICAWEENGHIEFFDPTCKYCPLENIPESDIDRPALVLNPNNPRHIVVPPANKLPSIEVAITGNIDSLKTCKAVLKLRNSSLFSALYAVDELRGVDLENRLGKIITPNFQKISFEGFAVQSRHDSLLTLTATADLSRFIVSSTTKKYVPYTPFRTVESDIFDREKDSSAIYLTWRDNLALRIDMHANGYTTEPVSVQLGDMETTGFAASSATNTHTVQVLYRYTQHTKVIGQHSKQHFLDFCKQYFKLKKNMFTLSKVQ